MAAELTPPASAPGITVGSLEQVLEVTRRLAAPFDLPSMLAAVTVAARQVLRAERCSVWLHDAAAGELVLEVATDLRHVRVPVGTGLVGVCARDRAIVNVPDCYADPRFDPSTDRASGYRTRCSLTLPLVDHDGGLVGVMQVLNRVDGVFGADDERLAQALAAQCAVALQRARLTEALIESGRMRQELEVARVVQTSSLPSTMPVVAGYDCHGLSRPATMTGGDTFDLARVGGELLVVLADATGHGIGPALSVTQMHAMLRMALRLGTDLETAFLQLNNLLGETMAEDRFITAFIGLLDPLTHRLHYISAGQGPILHVNGASGACSQIRPTCFPLGAMPLGERHPQSTLVLGPGDLLVLLSDGIYEYRSAGGELFGTARVEALLADRRGARMQALAGDLLAAVQAFAQGEPQDDDITIVLLRRESDTRRASEFERRIDALPAIFDFTGSFWADSGAAAELRRTVDFVLEELFTNIVKYGGGTAPVRIELRIAGGGVEVTIDDPQSNGFDPTQAPDVDIDAPVDERRPGGLGLHLIRRMVDSIGYRCEAAGGPARISFAKRVPSPEPEPASTKDGHVVD